MKERKVIDGAHFRRDSGEKLWRLDGNYHDKEQPPGPHVICDCGASCFILRYGYYELKARCMNCGIEEAVYSG